MYEYTMEFEDEEYVVYLCWLDGYYEVTPEILNSLTYAIIRNPTLILDLLKSKKLKAV